MVCSNCGTENRAGRKFCSECAAPLAVTCPSCGAANEPSEKFCGECASPLIARATAPVAGATSTPAGATLASPAGTPASGAPAVTGSSTSAPAAERRLVSVLFADLVGFTTLAEGRDAEETRELLSRYFELAREVISRYGGVVEKFIGDAVMAVWGTPTAHEDDAERAVRAALDLVARVERLGQEIGLSELRLRAGVMTGEAAVSIGATGQGMVAGDLVNTASRLQAAAAPSTVLVGESTYLAARGAIAFEAAGDLTLKGKAAPEPAWRAIGVVAMVRGANRAETIEPPFVGREAEFHTLKELVHATGRECRARMVSIVGVAGIGKSRLAWELEKYIDGLVEPIYWHHGRSPAYGDGITFWALGEMVRRRAGIAETDDEARTASRLEACLRDYIADDEERRWVGPALRALLGLEGDLPAEREELFAAWRTFFERVAARGTTVLVFEDLQWADPGQLDFIESVLEWSRAQPVLIVTLARPELLDRRPDWGASQRHFTGIHLEPLTTAAMTELVTGLAPGLPAAVVGRIVERAGGVPLYAVETFRMLVDAGRLVARDGRFEVVGDLPSLEVPTSLQSLIGARLDALDAGERALLQDGAVLGQTFTADALKAVTSQQPAEVDGRLRSLVRRELLATVADPRSPERGQYDFVQSLIREVAYSTLARAERRARHLAAARYFEALGGNEIAGVLATHYVEAFSASREGPEADAVAAQARIALRGAAERALALRAPDQAVTYLEQAIEVTTDSQELARLHEEAAQSAHLAADDRKAEAHIEAALAGFRAQDDRLAIARVTALHGGVLLLQSQTDAAVAALEAALAGLPDAERDPTGVELMSQLARAAMFQSDPARALDWLERGFVSAARLDSVAMIAELLVTKAWALGALERMREAIAVSYGAIEMSREHGLVVTELRARNNLATFYSSYEPRRSLEVLAPAVELAERIGHREWIGKLGFRAWVAFEAGDWDLAGAIVEAQLRDDLSLISYLPLQATGAILAAWRGDPSDAERRLEEVRRRAATGATDQDLGGLAWGETLVAIAAGRLDDAARSVAAAVRAGRALGDAAQALWSTGVIAAWLGDTDALDAAQAELEALPAVLAARPAMQAHLRGVAAALRGDRKATARWLAEATDGFRRSGAIWDLALADLDAIRHLGPDDPLGRAALEEVTGLARGWRSNVLLDRIEATVAAARAPESRLRTAAARPDAALLEPSER